MLFLLPRKKTAEGGKLRIFYTCHAFSFPSPYRFQLEALSAAGCWTFDVEWILWVKTVGREGAEIARSEKTHLLRHGIFQEVGVECCNN